MKFGYLSPNSDIGIRPDRLARELEQRGYDSLWLPEHPHLPTQVAAPYHDGGDIPEGYRRIMDPFVSLTAAATATDQLLLYTGVCLVLEHDVLDLACSAATLDVLSGGRFRLGVGAGWIAEELRNHRPDIPFRMRLSAVRERVAALRALWSQDKAAFQGRWDRFQESWVYPKPTTGSVPVALGSAGPIGIRHAAEYADEWAPLDGTMLNTDGRPQVRAAVERFIAEVQTAGRDPETVPISIVAMDPFAIRRLHGYVELGVARIVAYPPSMDLHTIDETLRHLDRVDKVRAQLGI